MPGKLDLRDPAENYDVRKDSVIESGKPKVIMIAYYFPPGQEIGGRRPFRFHKYLRRMGFECHVITASRPEEPCPPGLIWVPDTRASRWDGSSHEKRTLAGNIELLLRKFLFPGHLGLMWAYDAALHCRQIIEANPSQKFIVFSTFPPLGVLLAALLVRWRTRTPWINDFRDPIDIKEVAHISRWHLYCNFLVERAVFRAADCIIANTQSATDMLTARYPWAGSKTHAIWNGFDPEEETHARTLPEAGKKVVLHAGALYFARNPNLIIESLSRLWEVGVPEVQQVCVTFLGIISQVDIKSELYDEGQRRGWLKLSPPVPRAEAQRIAEQADGFLLVQPQSQVQVPGKLYEYICIGRPILALVPRDSAVEQILAKAGIPYVCVYTDDDADTADRKILEFLRLPPEPMPYSEWFRENFNAEFQARQLANVVEQAFLGRFNVFGTVILL